MIEGFLSVHSVGLADCNCLITGVGMQLTVHSHCPIAHIYIYYDYQWKITQFIHQTHSRKNTLPHPVCPPDFLPENSCFLCTSVGTFGVDDWPLRVVLRDRLMIFFFFAGRSSVRGNVASSPVPWSDVALSPRFSRLPFTGRPKVSRKSHKYTSDLLTREQRKEYIDTFFWKRALFL